MGDRSSISGLSVSERDVVADVVTGGQDGPEALRCGGGEGSGAFRMSKLAVGGVALGSSPLITSVLASCGGVWFSVLVRQKEVKRDGTPLCSYDMT